MSTTIEQLAGIADAMHALLVKRADQLANSIDGSADVSEYLTVLATIVAYEGMRERWLWERPRRQRLGRVIGALTLGA